MGMSQESSSIHGRAFGLLLLGRNWSIETHEDAQSREGGEIKRKTQLSFFGSHGRTILQFKIAILRPECPESQSS